MKVIVIFVSVVALTLAIKLYTNNAIDVESGKIVESVLADNTISSLVAVSDIKRELQAGNIELAIAKIESSEETYKFILANNCGLSKCKEALASHAE